VVDHIGFAEVQIPLPFLLIRDQDVLAILKELIALVTIIGADHKVNDPAPLLLAAGRQPPIKVVPLEAQTLHAPLLGLLQGALFLLLFFLLLFFLHLLHSPLFQLLKVVLLNHT